MSSSSESEEVGIKNGDLFAKQKAEQTKKSKCKKDKKADDKKDKKADDKSKAAKDWTEEETNSLIELLENKSCLWDIYHKDYKKRDLKEIAYSEIATALDTTIASVKTKINSLRTNLSKEVCKERATKSGQSTDELYVSKWVHYQQLAFLIPIIGASKSRDSLKRTNSQIVGSDEELEMASPKNKKKTIAERKLDLLSKCTDAITSNATKAVPEEKVPKPQISVFATYVDEKLSQLNKRDRSIAEKRISDILFEIEMGAEAQKDFRIGYFPSSTQQPGMPGMSRHVGNHGSYVSLQSNTEQGQSFMDMMTQ